MPAAITALEASSCSCSRSCSSRPWSGLGESWVIGWARPRARARALGGLAGGVVRGGRLVVVAVVARGAGAADPADQPQHDREEQQADRSAHDQPDHLAHLGRADRQLDAGAERVPVEVGHRDRHVVHAELVGGRLEQPGGRRAGVEVDPVGHRDVHGWARGGLDAHRHRLVEPVGDRDRERPGVAGEDDPARTGHRDRVELLPDPPGRADGGHPGAHGVLAGGVRQVAQAVGADPGGEVVLDADHALEVVAPPRSGRPTR